MIFFFFTFVLPAFVSLLDPKMRPDKKKTRHHDSRRREAAAKAKLGEGKSGRGEDAKRREEPDRGGDGAAAAAAAVADAAEEEGGGRYSKRKVVSNWTKYEIPSSDGGEGQSEEEEQEEGGGGGVRTGRDFNSAVQDTSEWYIQTETPFPASRTRCQLLQPHQAAPRRCFASSLSGSGTRSRPCLSTTTCSPWT